MERERGVAVVEAEAALAFVGVLVAAEGLRAVELPGAVVA